MILKKTNFRFNPPSLALEYIMGMSVCVTIRLHSKNITLKPFTQYIRCLPQKIITHIVFPHQPSCLLVAYASGLAVN